MVIWDKIRKKINIPQKKAYINKKNIKKDTKYKNQWGIQMKTLKLTH
jgi:hypothetical protein